MEHDSRLFGIHKSVWQDWPCILRAVRVSLSVKHNSSAGSKKQWQKRNTLVEYKRDEEWKSSVGG